MPSRRNGHRQAINRPRLNQKLVAAYDGFMSIGAIRIDGKHRRLLWRRVGGML